MMAQGDFPEGATATHKDGRKIVFRDGEWRVAQGASGSGGASGAKPAGVEQSNAASFLRRALGAAAAYQQQGLGPRSVAGKTFNASFPDLANTIPEFVGGNSESQQVADTSKLEFIAATLRKDSGANLPDSEIATQDRIYFPQPGEGPKVIEAKARARERVIRGLIDAAGSAVTEDLKKTYPNFFPTAQTEGGDQTSGTAGAVGAAATPPAGPTATPPAPGAPPQGEGDIGFNVAKPANEKRLTADEEAQFAAFLPTATPDSIVKWIGDRGLVITPEAAQNAIDAFKKTGVAPQFGYVKPEVDITDVRGEGGVAEGARAFVRGIPAVVGLDDELNAVLDGGDYEKALQKERAVSAYDEENNFWPRLAGQVVAGAAIPSGATGAARAAGIAAIRGGATKEAAQAVAARVFATRTAQEAAGLGGAYGAGNAEGGIVDRAAGAVTGAAVGAAAGGATGYAGSRIAQALRARAAARGAPSEASRLVQTAQEQDIQLLPQDVAAGPGIGRATAGAAQTPFGANTVRRRATQTYESFRDRVGVLAGGPMRTLNDVGAPIKAASATRAAREAARADETSGTVANELGAGSDITGAGQLIQRGATKWLRDTQEKAGQLYDRVSIPNSFDATLDATRGALKDLTEGFKSNKALSSLWAENPRLKATLEALTPERGDPTDLQPEGELIGGTVAWGDLKRFRSILGEIVGRPGLEADGNQIAALRKLYGAVSEDMRTTAAEAGPNALKEFTRANSYFGARANRVRDTVAKVLGDDNKATAGEAFGSVDSALKESAAGDAGFARRVLASMPETDANAVRATIINRARGGDSFDPKQLARVWGGISERAKSVLLPQSGMREIMDDAAARAASASHDPLEGKSSEQVYLALERAAESRGDSVGLARQMAALSPDEGQAVRTLLVHRMGLATAGQQDAAGEAFSVAKFLTRWNTMTPEARTVLFGTGELRDNMSAVARLAERVKASEKLAGHSNTGAVNSFNATTGGLGGAAVALLTGHPFVAAGLAAPAAYQRISAEVLTSPRLLKWLAKAPKKPNAQAQRSHIKALSSIARSEPAIANEVLDLQRRLAEAFTVSPTRLAANEGPDRNAPVEGNTGDPQANQQGFQP